MTQDQIVKLKKERKGNMIPMHLTGSDLLDLNAGGFDQDKSVVMRTDSRLRESLVESVMRSKKEMSRQ